MDKAQAKKMITTAEAKTDNRSAGEKGFDKLENMLKNLTDDQTKNLILALKAKKKKEDEELMREMEK